MKTLLFFSIFTLSILCAVDTDLMKQIPGYDNQNFKTKVYSGYLNTDSNDRKLHYIFVQSEKGSKNSDPVTLWLNGGPGCSSLIGFLQQIGPYYLPEGIHYKAGQNLTKNPYSWHRVSNLLFLQSPAGVGFSYNHNSSFAYNDYSTQTDNMNALLDFFSKYSQYKSNKFYIAGQSYAGKYIPDLALRIDLNNRVATADKKINLIGFLIGNGVISFLDGSLKTSQIEYFIDHEFIDPEIIFYYTHSCLVDYQSAGCAYFNSKVDKNMEEINPYSVYDYCYYNDSFTEINGNKKQFLSQESILMSFANKKEGEKAKFNGAPCQYFDGMFQYFNMFKTQFHALPGISWNGPCAENITGKYEVDLSGSIHQLEFLLSRNYHCLFYNGDWDGVVPFTDTLKNFERLKLVPNNLYKPFFAENQHAGFTQLYSGNVFAVIKGASHMVPQTKRAAAFELFQSVMGNQFWQDEQKQEIKQE